MDCKIIFVGGIHGIGKTSFCRTIANTNNINHISSSNLISRVSNKNLGNKKQVVNITRNQDELISGIDKYMKYGEWYLLDGHFCLFGCDNKILKISIKTYRRISPIAIILLHDQIENISNRLEKRDTNVYSLELLEKLQESEIRHAQAVAEDLDVPYLECNPFKTINDIYNFVNRIMNKGNSS